MTVPCEAKIVFVLQILPIIFQSKEIGGLTVPTRNVLCGSLTGLTATVLTYPLDTIRTRMLFTTKHDKRYDSWRNTVQSIKSSSGIK